MSLRGRRIENFLDIWYRVAASTTSMASMTFTFHNFIKKITDCDGWIIPGTKMTITGPFLWNRSSKIQFFTDTSTISVRGC